MSWTTEISSWKSFSIRYDGSRINYHVLKEVYTLVALLPQAEWSSLENGDGVQFHRCGLVFVSDEYYQQEPHFEHFLKAPVRTVITASVADDNTSKLGLLTATRLEDGWMLAFTIHPENDMALSGYDYPKQKRRDNCIKYHLDTLRVNGDFWYQKVDSILEFAIQKLPNDTWRPWKARRVNNPDPRTQFRGQNFTPVHRNKIGPRGIKDPIIHIARPDSRPKSDSVVSDDGALLSEKSINLREDHSSPFFEDDFPRDIRPRRR
jgi:hypothetical protein